MDPRDVLSLSSVPSAALSRLGVHQSLLSKFTREIQERGPICSTRRRSAQTFSTPFPASALTRCPYHFRFFLFTAIVLGEGRRGNLGAVIPDLPAFCRTRSSCFFFNKWDSGIKEHRVFLRAEWVREGPAGLRRPRRLSPAPHRRLALPGAPSRKLDGQPAALGLSLGRYLLSFVQKNK